ncbi:MAG: hypothetical protein ACK40G_08295 [Cytophagaceae bacterium]
MRYFIFLIILFLPFFGIAQRVGFVHLGLGANSYKGDLNDTYQQWTASYHAGVLFNKKKRLNGQLNIIAGKIQGNNPDYVFEKDPFSQPNTFFTTSFININYDVHLNLIKKDNFILFISQGVGLIRFSPKDQFNAKLENNFSRRAKGEEYSNIAFTLPTSAGFIYIMPSGYAFGLQTGYLNPTTDYLDNISQWGNSDKKDNVFFGRLSLFLPFSIFHKIEVVN